MLDLQNLHQIMTVLEFEREVTRQLMSEREKIVCNWLLLMACSSSKLFIGIFPKKIPWSELNFKEKPSVEPLRTTVLLHTLLYLVETHTLSDELIRFVSSDLTRREFEALTHLFWRTSPFSNETILCLQNMCSQNYTAMLFIPTQIINRIVGTNKSFTCCYIEKTCDQLHTLQMPCNRTMRARIKDWIIRNFVVTTPALKKHYANFKMIFHAPHISETKKQLFVEHDGKRIRNICSKPQ